MSEAPHFQLIEALHGDRPFGTVLDAGTGPRSIRWLENVATDGWTAVTGDPVMHRQVERLLGPDPHPQGRLVLGNWNDSALLAGARFDTVLADHLLGAIEGFAPYFQTTLFPRLRPLTGRRLYVTGIDPYVVERPADEAGALVWRIGRYRDSCLLLLGRQPFREFPRDWVLAELERSGFKPQATRQIVLTYQASFVNSQIDMVRPGLDRLPDQALAQALIARGETLRDQALAFLARHGPFQHGTSYVIAADPV